jgi:hypothetical protein
MFHFILLSVHYFTTIDRSPLSTRDGKYGWNNFEEANEQLISKGWSWSEAWTIGIHTQSFIYTI